MALACAGLMLVSACDDRPSGVTEPDATTAAGAMELEAPTVTPLVSGLEGGSGSTVGPNGQIYVTEGAAGRITRVDPATGHTSTFASGLPKSIVGIGGAVDVAFIGRTAYVLVTLVGADVGGADKDGIYRVDGPSEFTVVADIGAYSIAHPPSTDYFIPTGVQYALEVYRGGFLVTDGHHNRVLRITRNGRISEFRTFANIVPTGLEVWGDRVLMAEAGPTPHLPADGKIVSFSSRSPQVVEIAAGGRLLVDVEFGRGRTLFGLAQGEWDGAAAGSPANPNTGALLRVDGQGGFTTVVDGLNQPTSVELIGNTAYVVTLAGDVVRIDHVARPPFGRRH
ncbi:MAG: ScyD/ScyE family protein [Gemmatimonadales bacterium]